MARPPKREHWHPPLYDKKDVRAVQAVASYAAGAEEPPTAQDCKRFLDWLIHTACATYDEPFRPSADDVRCYMLGRRSVGLAMVKMMNLKPEIFDE